MSFGEVFSSYAKEVVGKYNDRIHMSQLGASDPEESGALIGKITRKSYQIGTVPVLGSVVGAVRSALAATVLAVSTVVTLVMSLIALVPAARKNEVFGKAFNATAMVAREAKDQLIIGLAEIFFGPGYKLHKDQEERLGLASEGHNLTIWGNKTPATDEGENMGID